jgi:hypothetical protein
MSVTTNQVQRVVRASVWARRITTFLMAVMVAGLIWATFFVFTASPTSGAKIKIAQYVFTATALQFWAVKLWVMLFNAVVGALGFAFFYLLRSIFTNLSRGEIFCAPNVRHIRGLGLLLIAGGVLQWLMPFANSFYFMLTGYDKISSREFVRNYTFDFDAFMPFAYGALMILLSWIMAVGLGVREDADELRRDAELVI